MLIGIDASTVATGFAFGSVNDGAPKGGVWRLPGADELVFDRTLAGAAESLSLLIRSTGAEHVFIEAPLNIVSANHAAHTAMALIQLTGALRSAAKRAGCKISLIAVSTVRKAFIGNGGLASAPAKRAVQDRCKQLGWPCESSDQADANAVWFYGMTQTYRNWQPKAFNLFAEVRE